MRGIKELQAWAHEGVKAGRFETIEEAFTWLADEIGLANQCSVKHWAYGIRPVRDKHVLALERATGGAVSRHVIRSDLYPREQAS